MFNNKFKIKFEKDLKMSNTSLLNKLESINDQLNLTHYWIIFLKYKRIILLVPILFGVLGFFIALNKIYVTNSDGKLIIVNSNEGNIFNIVKISGGKILQPFINENNLFLISNGSVIKYN